MKKINYLVLVVVGVISIYSCNKKNESETILTGTATILVDETILPVIEDQVMVFENQYKAKINLVPKSESEIVKLLSEGKNDLAILTRELTNGEATYFENKKIKARVTPIASDGVAFIAHKSLATSQIELNDIVAMIQGKSSKYAGLVFDNANSSIFNGMAPGVYTFRVTDSCGNQSLRLFEVSGNVTFSITATAFCVGSVGSLSVSYFPYLQYEWWKNNNISTILSTSNSLQFNPFNFTTDFGTYHVKITNPGNPNTCINFIVDYTIQGASSTPDAGGDAAISYCGNQGTVNLFDLLSGTYDANGVWQELTNSGTLTGNLWNATNVTPGIYNFKYTVNGLCGLQDEALVTITIKDIPQTPIASFDPIVCDSGTLQLHATPVAGATYLWNGPNGFNSTLQNPVIANISASNNGVYTVIAVKEGCPSESNSIVVNVKNAPNFSISETCFNGIKQLSITSTGDSITQDFSNYVWTFPDGTSHTGNPMVIANGITGVYSVEVQNQDNCITSKQIMVKCTSCGYIPKGVSANEDGKNDAFDLQCLEDVKNVKIFNRYGMLLFDKDNYLNECKGYDKNGTLLPTATYYYLITFGSGETKTGWVYLNY